MRKFGNILFYIVIAVIIISTVVSSFKGFISGQEVTLGGYGAFTIESDSMNPVIKTGSLVIYKKVEPQEISVGDIISYYKSKDEIETHRVIEILDENNRSFITKGDANDIADSLQVPDFNVIGRVETNIPYLGAICHFLQTGVGIMSFISITLLVILVIDFITKNKENKVLGDILK